MISLQNGDVDRETIQQFDRDFVLPTYRRQDRLFVRGKGCRIWDSEDNEYLDFLAGIAVDQLGHCHPAMVEALTRQANTLIHTSNNLLTPPQPLLAKKLHELTGMDRAFFANCGTTAVESALKIARKYGNEKCPDGDFEIIALDRSFHGRTLGALSATMQPKYQKPFGPLLSGFRSVPANDIEALTAAVSPKTAAIIIEPIQGEGGLTTMTEGFLRAARALADQHHALLIIDEVQTGMGRTGYWLAIQKFGIQADIVCLAKGLGSGVPIGACLTRDKANTVLAHGEHGSTFGGNALVCAVALAVLETIERDGLLAHTQEMGAYLAAGLASIGEPIVEVRGEGLMRGAVLSKPIARDVVRWCIDRFVIVNATDDNTLRLVPPLIVQKDDIDRVVAILKEAFVALG